MARSKTRRRHVPPVYTAWTTWRDALKVKNGIALMSGHRPDLFRAWRDYIHKKNYRKALKMERDGEDICDFVSECGSRCYAHWRACPNRGCDAYSCDCWADQCTCVDDEGLTYYKAHPEALAV